MLNSDYDVFITCKSEDYKYAEEIYEFLSTYGVKSFLASKELRRLGESEYRKAISSAMQQAYLLIIFASKAEYIDSTWVYYEWDMYITAKLKGSKNGNIITILKEVNTDDINMDLWKYESLQFDSYKDSIIQYVETVQSKNRLKELNELKEKDEAERNKIREEKKKKDNLKNELKEEIEKFITKQLSLSIEISRIKSLLKLLGKEKSKCLVCGTSCSINDDYCKECGALLIPFISDEDSGYLSKQEKERISIHKHLFDISTASENSNSNEKLLQCNKALSEQLEISHIKYNLLKKENEELSSRIKILELHKRTWQDNYYNLNNIKTETPQLIKELFPDWKKRSTDSLCLLSGLFIIIFLFCLWSLGACLNNFPHDIELIGWVICGFTLLSVIYFLSRTNNKNLFVINSIILTTISFGYIVIDGALFTINFLGSSCLLGLIYWLSSLKILNKQFNIDVIIL